MVDSAKPSATSDRFNLSALGKTVYWLSPDGPLKLEGTSWVPFHGLNVEDDIRSRSLTVSEIADLVKSGAISA
jgi:hypothetical protein